MAPVPHGTAFWAAQLSPDLDGSRHFYGSLFGWQFANVAPSDAPPFLVAQLHGHNVASLTAPQDPATWIIAVAVDALDDARRNAVAAGGSAPGESVQIATLGRFHRLHDPLGAEIHVVEPDPGGSAALHQRAGAWVASSLRVHDVAAVAAFYEAVLGWKMADEDLAAPVPAGTSPRWTPHFCVADLDDAADLIRAEGGTVDAGASAADGATVLEVTDPFGAGFTIVESSAP